MVHPLQPFTTDRLVLRGCYQTVPIAIYGYGLEAAAAAAPPLPPPTRLTLAEALQRLPVAVPQPPVAPAVSPRLQQEAQQALAQLLGYWQAVGTSERLMLLHPPPLAAFQAAAAVADRICAELVGPGRQQQQQQQQQDNGSSGSDGATAAPTRAAPGGAPLLVDWVHTATDMAMCWCGLMAMGAAGRTRAAVHCGAAGLAAAVLLCSSLAGALQFLTRGGVVLLADVLTMPRAPAGFTRHATAACLLLARTAGVLGCEAVLGWWHPARGLVWTSRHSKTAGAGGGTLERQEGEEAPAGELAAVEDDDEEEEEIGLPPGFAGVVQGLVRELGCRCAGFVHQGAASDRSVVRPACVWLGGRRQRVPWEPPTSGLWLCA